MSEKTARNIAQARAHSLWAGPLHIEYKLWTGRFKVFPRWQLMTTEFFNEGPVTWLRLYWLTFGLSVYKAFDNRRGDEEARIRWDQKNIREYDKLEQRGGRWK